METYSSSQALNAEVFEQLSPSSGHYKQALDAINDFTRTMVREREALVDVRPELTITFDELDRVLNTDKPYKVIDKEPDSPAAQTVPYATLDSGCYIRGPRYPVLFARVVTPRFIKDVIELGTWKMDIRQVISDNSIKDLLAEKDSKNIRAINSALISSGATLPWSGQAQWVEINGGITRDTLIDAFKVVPSTKASIPVASVLVNHITHMELSKFTRNEMGGDFSQSVLKDGQFDANFNNKKWVVTIKKNLVPTGSIYTFGPSKFLGKAFALEPVTMYVKREHFMLEFFAYGTFGCTWVNNGLGRIDFR